MNTQKIPVVLLNDTRVDRHHGCLRVMSTLENLLGDGGFSVTASVPAHTDWRDNEHFLSSLGSSRLLLVNGEGTIHHDRPAGRRLLESGAAARANGVPAALINAGWEENSPEFTALLRNFTLIALRDSGSAAEVSKSGIDCRIVPDLSLYSKGSIPEFRMRNGIGFTDNVDRLSAIHMDHCRRKMGADLVSIVFTKPGLLGYLAFLRNGIGLRDDIPAPTRIARMLRLRHLLWRVSSPDISVFLNQISRLRLLVSGRFHACTLAISAGTPFVAISSNTRKIASLVEDAGLDSWRIGVPFEPLAISAAAEHGWSRCERSNISDYLTRTRQAVETLIGDLRSLAQ